MKNEIQKDGTNSIIKIKYQTCNPEITVNWEVNPNVVKVWNISFKREIMKQTGKIFAIFASTSTCDFLQKQGLLSTLKQ